MKETIDGQILKEGDRVYSYDYNEGRFAPKRCYGTLHKNEDYPEVSEWYIKYDDGEECAVLDIALVFKANARYIVFCIDSIFKDHYGKIFSSLQEAKAFAKDLLTEMYVDKAVVGMFVWDDGRPEISISMVETLGFKGDKKKVEDMQLFEPYKPIKNPVKKKQ